MTPNEQKIQEIREYGKRAKGQQELIRHLQGYRLTPGQKLKAQCYDCMCYYADGVEDCESPLCPLYPAMPYRKSKVPQTSRLASPGMRKNRSAGSEPPTPVVFCEEVAGSAFTPENGVPGKVVL